MSFKRVPVNMSMYMSTSTNRILASPYYSNCDFKIFYLLYLSTVDISMMIYNNMYNLIMLSYVCIQYTYLCIYKYIYIYYIHALYQILINPTSVLSCPASYTAIFPGRPPAKSRATSGETKNTFQSPTNQSRKSNLRKKTTSTHDLEKDVFKKNMTFRIHFKKIWMKNMIRD